MAPDVRPSAPPDIRPLLEALALADRFDIPFYKNLAIQAMSQTIRLGHYRAMSAYSFACAIGDIFLARGAVAGMVGAPAPLAFPYSTVKELNVGALWMLVMAWRRCRSFDARCAEQGKYHCNLSPHWDSTGPQWLEVAEKISFQDVVRSSAPLRSRLHSN